MIQKYVSGAEQKILFKTGSNVLFMKMRRAVPNTVHHGRFWWSVQKLCCCLVVELGAVY